MKKHITWIITIIISSSIGLKRHKMVTYNTYIRLLKEAVIYTHNITKYNMNLSRELDFIGISNQLNIINKMSFDIQLLKPNQLADKNTYDAFFSIVQNQFGYYPSFYRVLLNNGNTNTFYFKEKYKNDKEYSLNKSSSEKEFKKYINANNIAEITIRFEGNYEDVLYKNTLKIPNVLYHISPTIYENSILSEGLFPKSKKRSSYYPDRIHFSYTMKDYMKLINMFKLNDVKKGKPKRTYSLYKIDTKNIKDSIILHSDPNSSGCFTYDVIPKENIKLLKSNL